MIRQGLVRKEDINLYTLLLPILVLSVSDVKNNRGRQEEPLTRICRSSRGMPTITLDCRRQSSKSGNPGGLRTTL